MRILSLLLALIALAGPAMASEEPDYTLVERDGDFEIRDYPELILAEVTVEGDRREASNKGFRPLASYIFGGNEPGETIAMTAPVTSTREDAPDTMSEPVTSEPAGEGRWRIAFIMPSDWTMDTLPEPKAGEVRVREQPPRRVAVLRFSGLMGEDRIEEKLSELQSEMAERDLEPQSAPVYAAYNPPWIPGPMRRNEIWVEIAAD